MKCSLGLLALVLSLTSVATLANNTLNFAHISTTGYGEIVATPDMATFSVKVVDTTMTAEQAKQSVDSTVDAFLKRLADAGLAKDNITSSNLYLTPQYHYPKSGQSELVGYRASRRIDVTIMDLTQLNQYLDMALEAGLNQVDSIQLKVSNHSEYQQKARMAAVKDAQSKAAFLANGFDKKLGDVWQINYHQMQTRPLLMRSMEMNAKSSSDSYQDSSLVIRDQVDVIYKLQ